MPPPKSAPRRRGRPPIAKAAKASSVTIRIESRLRDALVREQVKRNSAGWSLSREIERRLKGSFDETLTKSRDDETVARLGGPETYALIRMLVSTIEAVQFDTNRHWSEDRYTWEAVRDAFLVLFGELAPKGESKAPAGMKWDTKTEVNAPAIALGEISQVMRADDEPQIDFQDEDGAMHRFASGYRWRPGIKRILREMYERREQPGFLPRQTRASFFESGKASEKKESGK